MTYLHTHLGMDRYDEPVAREIWGFLTTYPKARAQVVGPRGGEFLENILNGMVAIYGEIPLLQEGFSMGPRGFWLRPDQHWGVQFRGWADSDSSRAETVAGFMGDNILIVAEAPFYGLGVLGDVVAACLSGAKFGRLITWHPSEHDLDVRGNPRYRGTALLDEGAEK